MASTKGELINEHFLLLAGEANLRAQREAERALMDGGLSLPQAQERERSGVVGIHLVRSMYGWSVRYSSGLQGFALLRPSSLPSHIGPREHKDELKDYLDARAYAVHWADNYRGYAYVSRGELERYGIQRAAEALERVWTQTETES